MGVILLNSDHSTNLAVNEPVICLQQKLASFLPHPQIDTLATWQIGNLATWQLGNLAPEIVGRPPFICADHM